MKYSVKGSLRTTDASVLMATLGKYTSDISSSQHTDPEGHAVLIFEAWVASTEDKTAMFEDLKPLVDMFGEAINWHECSHEETVSRPCVIRETYSRR